MGPGKALMATSASSPSPSIVRPLPRFFYSPFARRIGGLITYLLPFAVLVTVWQVLASSGRFTLNQLPPPSYVGEVLQQIVQDGSLFVHVSQSLARLLLGVVMGSLMGIALGVIMGLNRGLAEFIEPLASFLNALSGIAWIPLSIVWFGIGPGAVTFILWNAVFFLVFFNTLLGVLSVPPIYRNAILTLGGSTRHVVRDVILPGALPNIMLGLRMGLGFGWRALVAAEMIGATSGLGYFIYNASYYLRSDMILAGIIVIGLLVLATDRLVWAPLERWTVERWGLVRRMD
jgi:NitT/TauT family transport system permease protein/taurine transport system permease protein